MTIRNIFVSAALFTCICYQSCKGQTDVYIQPLKLEREIALGDIKGRIDHICVNIKGQIAYVAALGNNTVEVVDLKKGVIIRSIKGLDEPQGLLYIPKHNLLFVANGGTGICDFYNATDFKKTTSVSLSSDADNVRYDEAADKIYVGYGDGGIVIIDAGTKKVGADIKLPAHPESFQLDAQEGKIWVNLPNAGMIGVVDIKQTKLIAQWKKLLPRFNFPMAYDEIGHRIMVGYRFPSTLKVLDSRSGKEIFSSGIVNDTDDLYWDSKTEQIFVTGGGGDINVFQETADNNYKLISKIETPKGARTSLLVPELRMFLLAVRTAGDKPAKLLVYKLVE